MFFNRKSHIQEQDDSTYEYVPATAEIQQAELDINFYETERKRAFYSVLNGKTVTQILDDITRDFTRRIVQQNSISNQKIQLLEQQITALRNEIIEKKELLKNTRTIEERYETEIFEVQSRIEVLNNQFQTYIKELGIAHENMIPDRIRAAKQELEAMTAAYQEIFKSKFKDEAEFLKALEKRRAFLDQRFEDTQLKLTAVYEKLNRFVSLGNSRFSSRFIFSIGALSAVAAGWFFSVFSSSNDFNGQTWLFFGLSNFFNFLFLHIRELDPLNAFKTMLLNFSILLAMITAFFWLIQYIIVQITNDQSNIELVFNTNEKSRHFFRLKIKAKSILSFWLHILPWIFVLGIVFIVLAIGQYVGKPADQITELAKKLSGQMAGTTITLLSTAVFFLFSSRLIERNPETKGNVESSQNSIMLHNHSGHRKGRVYLVVAINSVVLLLIINQVIASRLPIAQMIFAILCFLLLLNLTIYALSFGIRQRGLLKTQQELESKLSYLSNLRAAISGSTPVQLWIREGNQFQKGFLEFQQDILELVKQKNQLLNPYKRFKIALKIWKKEDDIQSMSAERFGEITKSPDREKQFFLRNFPEISYKIATVRNKLNEAKRELDVTKTRLTELRDGHSDFQNNLNDEIRVRKGQITMLQNTQFQIRQNNLQFTNVVEQQQKQLELEVMKGSNLAIWAKEAFKQPLLTNQCF